MKKIQKNNPPASLVEHQKKRNADYDNYPQKDELRACLTNEQRSICCYCMGFIKADIDHMKIEHYKNQHDNPELQIKYPNLLGACRGNEGEQEKLTHCDTFKGNKELTIYPPGKMPNVESLFEYGNDGTMSSQIGNYNAEINDILNLNAPILIKNRKATLDGFKDFIQQEYNGNHLKKETINKWISNWSGISNKNNLRPYCMVIVYWLQKKLNRA